MQIQVRLNPNLNIKHLIGKPVRKYGMEVGKIVWAVKKGQYLIATVEVDDVEAFKKLTEGKRHEGN